MIDTEFERHGEAFRAFVKAPLNVLLSPTQTIKTMKQKTILEWLQLAKELGYDWADAAIANCDKYKRESTRMNMSNALTNAFDWTLSKEGFVFWDNIFDSLQNNNQ